MIETCVTPTIAQLTQARRATRICKRVSRRNGGPRTGKADFAFSLGFYRSLRDTLYPRTHTDDCYAVVVWRDDEIRAGRERVHTNELVKGDCPSTRKQSHRSRASIPRSPLTRRTRTPRVPVHVPTALLVCRYFGGGAWMCQLPRLTPLCNVQIIE